MATDTDRLDRSDRLTVIRNLLAKAEASDYPEEAEAFTAKASELMARHAIDEAMLWAAGRDADSTISERFVVVHRPFVAQKSLLVDAVARAYGCSAIRISGDDDRHSRVALVGFETDLAFVETLVTSLLVQLVTSMTAHHPGPATSGAATAAWRRSFISAFAEEVRRRLDADVARARRDHDGDHHDEDGSGAAGPSVSVVLARRNERVADEVRSRYPFLRTSRVSRGTSSDGHRRGTRAGRTADLGGPRLGGRAALGAAV
ncbi:MAG: DUF2786 domain-containing protein [Microthrixaceae bacterium]